MNENLNHFVTARNTRALASELINSACGCACLVHGDTLSPFKSAMNVPTEDLA